MMLHNNFVHNRYTSAYEFDVNTPDPEMWVKVFWSVGNL